MDYIRDEHRVSPALPAETPKRKRGRPCHPAEKSRRGHQVDVTDRAWEYWQAVAAAAGCFIGKSNTGSVSAYLEAQVPEPKPD